MILEMRFSNLYSIKDEVCIDFKDGKVSNNATDKNNEGDILSYHPIKLDGYVEKFYLQGRFDAVPYINSSLATIKGIFHA